MWAVGEEGVAEVNNYATKLNAKRQQMKATICIIFFLFWIERDVEEVGGKKANPTEAGNGSLYTVRDIRDSRYGQDG